MDELGEVLRAWRDRLTPAAAGLPAGANRRAPGLRREELAGLAGLSVEYVVRLEQGRARNPSSQVLGALARALRLEGDERDHLFRVAGAAVPSSGLVPTHIGPGVQRMIDRLGDVPLAVHTAAWDLLMWNSLWAALTGDPAESDALGRNVAWRHFTRGPRGVQFDEQHADQFAADLVADLREAAGRFPHDRGLAELVRRLRSVSTDFESRWGQAHVARHLSSRKTVTSTPVGSITLDCDVLTVPGTDLRIVIYTAAPGTEDSSKLDLLRVTEAHAVAR